jgi:hypothetical protein
MTDRNQPKESEDKKATPVTVVLILVLAVLSLAFIIFFLPKLFFGFVILFEGSGETQYGVACYKFNGELSTGENVRENWVISDNITGYEDIPQSQKQNLSNDTIEVLKELPHYLYNATNYTDMSEERKTVFRKALNENESAVVDSRDKTPYTRVFYQGNLYSCDTDRIPDGA